MLLLPATKQRDQANNINTIVYRSLCTHVVKYDYDTSHTVPRAIIIKATLLSCDDGFEHKMAYARRRYDVAARPDATRRSPSARRNRYATTGNVASATPVRRTVCAVTARRRRRLRSAPVADGRRLGVTVENKSPGAGGVVVDGWGSAERRNKPLRLPLPATPCQYQPNGGDGTREQ